MTDSRGTGRPKRRVRLERSVLRALMTPIVAILERRVARASRGKDEPAGRG